MRQNTNINYLIDGIPIWQKENRGMTEEEAEALLQETEA